MMRKPEPDRFTLGEEIAAETPAPSPTPATRERRPRAVKPEPKPKAEAAPTPPLPAKRPGVRPPNTPYERSGRIYVKCPKSLCRALDRAVLAEKEKRDPTPMDKGIAIEEAVRLWLKAKGYPTE